MFNIIVRLKWDFHGVKENKPIIEIIFNSKVFWLEGIIKIIFRLLCEKQIIRSKFTKGNNI
jgi:hypothetical protein